MNLVRKISSVLMLLVFTFPIGYQAHHILTRHADFENFVRHNSCCHAGPVEIPEDDGQAFSTPGKKCLVVDFEYTTYEHSTDNNPKYRIYSHSDQNIFPAETYNVFFRGSNEQLRAPPATC